VRAIRRFTVRPVLPHPLGDLAVNLRWCWHTDTQKLFEQIDPALWQRCGHDPGRLLAGVSSDRLATLAQDRTFLCDLALIEADLAQYMDGDHWYQQWSATADGAAVPRAIGYFSPEFGITEVLPQYSGGLGILAGDHLKSASDLGVPIIGVGLLYRQGYFRQSLNTAGWQQERYPVTDPVELPLKLMSRGTEPVRIQVSLGERTLSAQVWLAQVGRVPLLMLDSDIEHNAEPERAVTDRLYGGGVDHRLAQEILLGIGGLRAIREYCAITGHAEPDVFHTNEGHAGFLGLERIREYVEGGSAFDTALEQTRAGTLLTTHTPVPAGIDRFPVELVNQSFADFGLPTEKVVALGREDYDGGDPGKFNMAVMGFRLGQRANGVSQLHGQVSREMFHGLWPAFDSAEVPITSVTNGVHHQTWVHPEMLELLSSSDDRQGTGGLVDGYDWSALSRVDDTTLWNLKHRMRLDLVDMARTRLAVSTEQRHLSDDWIGGVLDPDILTFGFARRVPELLTW